MDRRHFLQLSAVGVVTNLTHKVGTGQEAFDLLPLLGPESVREIGRRYREMAPAELLVAWPRRARAAMVRDDFAAGRTVVIDGWVLSVTEARQCALYSLLPRWG